MASLWLGDDRIATDLARRWPSRRDCRGPGQSQAAQIVGCDLRLVACSEKGAAVSLQKPNPGLDVAGVP
jgi:hypothetical protein